jgi:hypothetical protein
VSEQAAMLVLNLGRPALRKETLKRKITAESEKYFIKSTENSIKSAFLL